MLGLFPRETTAAPAVHTLRLHCLGPKSSWPTGRGSAFVHVLAARCWGRCGPLGAPTSRRRRRALPPPAQRSFGTISWFGPISSMLRSRAEDILQSCATKGAFLCHRTEPDERTAGGAHGGRERAVVARILGKLIRNEAGGGPQRRLGRVPGPVSPSANECRPDRTEPTGARVYRFIARSALVWVLFRKTSRCCVALHPLARTGQASTHKHSHETTSAHSPCSEIRGRVTKITGQGAAPRSPTRA